MPNISTSGDATGLDQPRPVATGPDYDFTLTVEDVAERYAKAGYPRTLRTLQRYCVSGHLDARRVATAIGDKFYVAPYSVARHLAQVEEMASFANAATNRDQTRPAATPVALPIAGDSDRQGAAAASDETRPVATGRVVPDGDKQGVAAAPVEDRYLRQLERENDFLRDQVLRKDTQIGELTERAKETNFLIQGLQNLVLRLQPGRSDPAIRDHVSPPASAGGEGAVTPSE